MSEDEKTSVEFGGVTFTGGKMFALITALSTLGGGAWASFEVYADYMDMKEQIQSYEAPDLSGFQEQLSVQDEKMRSLEDSVLEARDYTRDIKIDLKNDIDRMESIIDDIERVVKSIDSSTRDQLNSNLKTLRELIDSADQRFDTKRDQLSSNVDRQITEVEEALNKRLQRALDNPLSD